MKTHCSLFLFPKDKIKVLHHWVKLPSTFPVYWRLCLLAHSSLRHRVRLSFWMTLEFTKPRPFLICILSPYSLWYCLPLKSPSWSFPSPLRIAPPLTVPPNISLLFLLSSINSFPFRFFSQLLPVHQLFHFTRCSNLPIPLIFYFSDSPLSSPPFSYILHQLSPSQWSHLPCTLIYTHPTKFQAQILTPVTCCFSLQDTQHQGVNHTSTKADIIIDSGSPFPRDFQSCPANLLSSSPSPSKAISNLFHFTFPSSHSTLRKTTSPPTSKTMKQECLQPPAQLQLTSFCILLPTASQHAPILGLCLLLTFQALAPLSSLLCPQLSSLSAPFHHHFNVPNLSPIENKTKQNPTSNLRPALFFFSSSQPSFLKHLSHLLSPLH